MEKKVKEKVKRIKSVWEAWRLFNATILENSDTMYNARKGTNSYKKKDCMVNKVRSKR